MKVPPNVTSPNAPRLVSPSPRNSTEERIAPGLVNETKSKFKPPSLRGMTKAFSSTGDKIARKAQSTAKGLAKAFNSVSDSFRQITGRHGADNQEIKIIPNKKNYQSKKATGSDASLEKASHEKSSMGSETEQDFLSAKQALRRFVDYEHEMKVSSVNPNPLTLTLENLIESATKCAIDGVSEEKLKFALETTIAFWNQGSATAEEFKEFEDFFSSKENLSNFAIESGSVSDENVQLDKQALQKTNDYIEQQILPKLLKFIVRREFSTIGVDAGKYNEQTVAEQIIQNPGRPKLLGVNHRNLATWLENTCQKMASEFTKNPALPKSDFNLKNLNLAANPKHFKDELMELEAQEFSKWFEPIFNAVSIASLSNSVDKKAAQAFNTNDTVTGLLEALPNCLPQINSTLMSKIAEFKASIEDLANTQSAVDSHSANDIKQNADLFKRAAMVMLIQEVFNGAASVANASSAERYGEAVDNVIEILNEEIDGSNSDGTIPENTQKWLNDMLR